MLERIDHTSRDLTRYTLGSLVFYYDFKKAVSYYDTDELNSEPKFSLGQKPWPVRPGKFY